MILNDFLSRKHMMITIQTILSQYPLIRTRLYTKIIIRSKEKKGI